MALTRKARALQLLQRVADGPSFGQGGYTPEMYRLWASTWIMPELTSLIKEIENAEIACSTSAEQKGIQLPGYTSAVQQTRKHYEMRYQQDYIAKLSEDGEAFFDIVDAVTSAIHADDQTVDLWESSRDRYEDCIAWVNEFETRYAGVEFDVDADSPDYYISVEDFVAAKLTSMREDGGEEYTPTNYFHSTGKVTETL